MGATRAAGGGSGGRGGRGGRGPMKAGGAVAQDRAGASGGDEGGVLDALEGMLVVLLLLLLLLLSLLLLLLGVVPAVVFRKKKSRARRGSGGKNLYLSPPPHRSQRCGRPWHHRRLKSTASLALLSHYNNASIYLREA